LNDDNAPQLVLTLMILAGFMLFVVIYMFADMTHKNEEIIKQLVISMGQACMLAIGFWFGQKSK
jgi:ABC-type multidrug transport system permease subunit